MNNLAGAMVDAAINIVAGGIVGGFNNGLQQQGNPAISQLAHTVAQKQVQAEQIAYQTTEPTVCGLYAHFLLSLLGIVECALRIIIIVVFLASWFIVYYLIQCASCGKNKDISMSTSYYLSAFWLYIGILCGLIGNLVVPWKPGEDICIFRNSLWCVPNRSFNGD